MKRYENISHRKNCDGSRTAFDAGGRSWSITGCTGNWKAKASVTCAGEINLLSGYETLDEISAELGRINSQ